MDHPELVANPLESTNHTLGSTALNWSFRCFLLMLHSIRKETPQMTQKHDRQCTCNVTIRSICVNYCCCGEAVSTKNCGCLSVFLPYLSGIYSTCAILYCHLWPVRFYPVFPHYLINGNLKNMYWPQNVF